ncbi:MAG: hypothetical protein U0936_18765 [Planctomycetaceae bacterium]
MPEHHVLISITIWLALGGYAITVALVLAGFLKTEWRHHLRLVWTLSCLAFVVHVISAFHFSYHWSHTEAIRSTAKQTQELIGMEFGEGLYFSYGFLLLWIADVLYWWRSPERYERRPAWLSLAVHGYLFFIAFNGAVIFKAGVTRVSGVLTTIVFVSVFLWRRFARS